jgi:hypothetical protein
MDTSLETDPSTDHDDQPNTTDIASIAEGDQRVGDTNGVAIASPLEDDSMDEEFPLDPDGRPVIDVTKPLHAIVDRCVRILANVPHVFQKRGELVQVVTEEPGDRLRPLKNPDVRTLLSRGARWICADKPTHPPAHVANCLVERTAWEEISILRAVTSFPAINAKGEIPTEAGYDEATKTYFTGEVRVELPDAPTQDDAQAAVSKLHDIVQDFGFASDEHKSAWLAGLLTPLARYVHDGNAPIVIVQANQPRVGKTTLVKVIAEIVNGDGCPVITFTRNEDESRKRLLSFLRTARSMVLVDNVIGQFGGANINAITTSRNFEDRVLGKSTIIEVVNDTSWYVTGNNIQLAPDTAERSLNVRLHCEEERANLRTNFRYPNLFETIRERRAELLSAALTILKAFIVAGKPDQMLPAWGGFEAWSRLVRGALVFAGQPDPAATRIELEEHSDVETDGKAQLIAGLYEWQERAGIKEPLLARDILSKVRDQPKLAPTLHGVLEGISGMRHSLPNAPLFARRLRDVHHRNFGGLRLMKQDDPKNGHRWLVERIVPDLQLAAAE